MLLGTALVACGPPEEPGGASESAATNVPADADVTVTVRDFAFDPEEITVAVGDTVAFVNEDERVTRSPMARTEPGRRGGVR